MSTKEPEIDGANAGWCQLLSWPSKVIFRGAIFRSLKAVWPYEEVVDFMVVVDHNSPCGFSLIVSTGYKAGQILVQLPVEAKAPNEQGLATEWITANWAKWIYPECPLHLVEIIENYPPSVQVETTERSG